MIAVKKDNKWIRVSGEPDIWRGSTAELDTALANNEIPDGTIAMPNDDYFEPVDTKGDLDDFKDFMTVKTVNLSAYLNTAQFSAGAVWLQRQGAVCMLQFTNVIPRAAGNGLRVLTDAGVALIPSMPSGMLVGMCPVKGSYTYPAETYLWADMVVAGHATPQVHASGAYSFWGSITWMTEDK